MEHEKYQPPHGRWINSAGIMETTGDRMSMVDVELDGERNFE